jgi:hypothetical protein
MTAQTNRSKGPKNMINLEDDIFQARCALDNLQRYIDDGGRVRHTVDDVVTLDLRDNSFTEINLAPVQHLLNVLRGMK